MTVKASLRFSHAKKISTQTPFLRSNNRGSSLYFLSRIQEHFRLIENKLFGKVVIDFFSPDNREFA